jgi:hypothetical protein
LLRRTIVAGMAEGVIQKRDLTEVLVDTTVMEKAITYPTDSKLYLQEPVATEPGRTAIGHRAASELHPHREAARGE